MAKDTAHLLRELETCSDFRSFYRDHIDELPARTLSECLSELLKRHGLKKADVIRRAELAEVYGYQIFSGLRIPERRKLLCLAIGMALPLDELQALLKATGYAPLYAKNPADCIVIYGVCRGYTVVQINEMLFDYGMETLG